MATVPGRRGRPGRKSSQQNPLEVSLENLKEVADSFRKKNSRKPSTFVYSYEGSGKRVPSTKPYKYRSVSERASKKARDEPSNSGWDTGESFEEVVDDCECDMTGEETFSSSNSAENLNINNCIEICEEVAKEIKSTTQSKRMHSVEANWESSRATIFNALLKSHSIPSPDAICLICGQNKAVVRCHQCGPRVLVCSNCDEEVHEGKPLHDRDVWVNGFFQPICPTATVLEGGSLGITKRCAPFLLCNECIYCKKQGKLKCVPSDETCIVITCQGRYDLFLCTYFCHGCGEQFSPLTIEKIISEGYWPGSPN